MIVFRQLFVLALLPALLAAQQGDSSLAAGGPIKWQFDLGAHGGGTRGTRWSVAHARHAFHARGTIVLPARTSARNDCQSASVCAAKWRASATTAGIQPRWHANAPSSSALAEP